jgi:cytochrome c-type biogenesis protein CcmE
MMTPQQQKRIVVVIAVVVGIAMVLSLVVPLLG